MNRLLIASICLFLVITKIPILYFFGMMGLILIGTFQVTLLIMHGMNKALGLPSDIDVLYSSSPPSSSSAQTTAPLQTLKTVEETQIQNKAHIQNEHVIVDDCPKPFRTEHIPYFDQLDTRHLQQLKQIELIFDSLNPQNHQVKQTIKQDIENLKQQILLQIEHNMQHTFNQTATHTNSTQRLFAPSLQDALNQQIEQLLIQIELIYANDMQLLKDHHIFITQRLQKTQDFDLNKNLHD